MYVSSQKAGTLASMARTGFIINYPKGAKCKMQKGNRRFYAENTHGTWLFNVPYLEEGDDEFWGWTISVTDVPSTAPGIVPYTSFSATLKKDEISELTYSPVRYLISSTLESVRGNNADFSLYALSNGRINFEEDSSITLSYTSTTNGNVAGCSGLVDLTGYDILIFEVELTANDTGNWGFTYGILDNPLTDARGNGSNFYSKFSTYSRITTSTTTYSTHVVIIPEGVGKKYIGFGGRSKGKILNIYLM